MTLEQIGDKIAAALAAHDDAVERWHDARDRGHAPPKPEPPIVELEQLAAEWRKERAR